MVQILAENVAQLFRFEAPFQEHGATQWIQLLQKDFLGLLLILTHFAKMIELCRKLMKNYKSRNKYDYTTDKSNPGISEFDSEKSVKDCVESSVLIAEIKYWKTEK